MQSSLSFIEVDGSMLEGGGQILRVSVALSAVSRVPVKVFNIRAKRSNPGLRPQHLTAIKAVAELVNARVEGLYVGSRELAFIPSKPKAGSFSFDVGTAGSTTLVLQSLMPAAALAPFSISVEVKGGTNNPMAPPVDYVERVLVLALLRMGYRCRVTTLRRGFYPRGGGVVRASMDPVEHLSPISLDGRRGEVEVKGVAYSCRLPSHIVERMSRAAYNRLREGGMDSVSIEQEVLQPGHPKCSLDPGCGILLVAEGMDCLMGSDCLGEKGKPAEVVGEEAANSLLRQLETQASVDKHLGDQLIVYMALAKGRSRIKVSELTLHTVTCIEVVKRLLGVKVKVEGGLGGPALIECEGAGLRRAG
ncbi:MAG: RNA 3'-terminal phosphate cyclase [Candidatus Nezhaarchaeota archaeon]|nr:RNA 3'-terminal phosphate cyclase [Candidatus Nezhaarchaeota archaeon]